MLRGLSDPHTGVLLRIQSEGRTFTKHKNKEKAFYSIRCKEKKKEDWGYRGAAGEGDQRMISGGIVSKSMSE